MKNADNTIVLTKDFYFSKNKKSAKIAHKNMINVLIANISNDVAINPLKGFCTFLVSLFVSVVPSFIEPQLLFQVQLAEYVFTMDIIVKFIQIVAGLLGIALSCIMIYVNIPKMKTMLKNNKKSKHLKKSK